MTMATNATSAFYSTGFADPNFLDSNQHSAKTDAYGIGISLLMALTGGEPSRGLRSAYEDDVLDMVAGKEGAGGGLLHAARRAAHWPQAATRELVKAVHGLVYERKSQRLPLPEALAAFEAALRFGGDDDGGADAGAAAAAAPVAAERPTASGAAFSASGATSSGASASASSSSGGGSAPGSLTRAVGGLHKEYVAGGGDASLARLQDRISNAYLSMMGHLERRHEQRGGAPLPKGSSEEEKINALAPRSAGQSQLCDSAHTLRRWYNACRHERGQWSVGARPSDKEVARVIERIRGLLDSERAQRA